MDTNPQKQRIEMRDYEVLIPTNDGLGVAERISLQVPMEWDAELKEWLITAEAEELLEDTKARHMGLVLPEELLTLRESLDLTQSEIAELLGIGEKTWTRWETGRQRPSQSLNMLLRAIQTGLLSVYDLRRLREPCFDWSRVLATRQAVVTMDLAWRSLQTPARLSTEATIIDFVA